MKNNLIMTSYNKFKCVINLVILLTKENRKKIEIGTLQSH